MLRFSPPAVVVSLLIGCGLPSLLRAAPDLPRYSLPVGRKLVYTSIGVSKPVKQSGDDRGSETHNRATWQATVVRENPDRSRRIIIRQASSYGREGRREQEDVELAYVDLFPEGRFTQNPSLGMQVDPSRIFPPLPKDANEWAQGWSKTNEMTLATHTFAQAREKGSMLSFTAVEGGPMNKIYEMTRSFTYHFDPAKGVVTSNDGDFSQGYGFESRGTSTMKLESDETLPAEKVRELADDFDRFFEAKKAYGELMAKVEREPQSADALLAEAKSLVEKARDAAKSEDAKTELAAVVKRHDQSAKYAKESSTQFQDVLNQPSPDWSTTDIDGKPVKLADYRGKVVVMDFWYRGCGWCMYAMPQVKQLAEDYKDKPVVVLGMNTDRDEKDARVVIDVFGLTYPTIKAEGIPEKYKVQGFPTLIIVDQNGVVRDVHVGYSPDLRETVSKKINELLNQTARASE